MKELSAPYEIRKIPTLQEVLDRTRGIGQGFDFLRIFLAISIVAFHSLLLTDNVWVRQTPLWFIEYALVPMFFALSGFLVTASGIRLSLKNFLINRGLRIVPALAVDIFVCSLIIGPIFTTFALHQYFSDSKFFSYFLNIFGYIHYQLPGVFENHASQRVNGALWTVPYEILCYILISFFIVFKLLHSSKKIIFLAISMVLIGSVFEHPSALAIFPKFGSKLIEFAFVSRESQIVTAFLVGVISYQLKEFIPYNKKLFLLSVVICLVAAMYPEYAAKVPSRLILLPVLTYITVFIGLTSIPIPKFLKRGDYSYGIYLYHDPILQSVISIFPAICMIPKVGAAFTFACGIPFVFLMASFSWHFIEKPILALRKKFSFVAKTRLEETPKQDSEHSVPQNVIRVSG